jgi:phosphate starvation-inducible protein PhoH
MNPYLLGSLIGDGGMTNNTLTFTNKDEEVLELVDNQLNEFGYHLNKLKHGNYDYNISSVGVIKTSGKKGVYTNLIKETLNDLGLYGKKSENKFIPEIYKKASKKQKLQLIQGLMDTDGTTDTRQCSVSYSTSSKQLCDDFVDIIRSIGGITNVKTKTPKYVYNNEIKYGLTNYCINIRYHNPKDLFSLSRKKNICEKYQHKNLKLGIEKIDYVGKVEAKCIMVEDSEHLYVTDNYIVTHNTFLACAEALKLLKNHETPFKKIILVKSVTTLKDEEIGFLKGTMEEKMEPFMDSFLDNFNKIIGEANTNKLREMKYIEIKPIAYVRGRSIDNSIIIMDEAQNISIDNMRTLMTRIGENSKMIILGDVKQKDLRNKKESSLEVVIERFKDRKGFGIVELRNEEDIVRNPIIKIIEDIFDQMEEEKLNNSNNNRKQFLKD